jgi:hypothetical protein
VARWRSLVVEALVIVLAVVATVQLRSTGQGLRGIAQLVPGLVVVAVAIAAARAFVPVAGLVARRALRDGRLGLGLAAVQLARRPGSQRLFVLLAVASAMLAFVAAGIDVANRAREDRALIATGASTVLTIDQADARRLLYVTRTVDPAGAWAMAAMELKQQFPQAPRLLAVDSARLPAVAAWRPEFGVGAPAVAAALRPPAPAPLLFRGTQLLVEIERVDRATNADGRAVQAPVVDLTLSFAPLVGGTVVSVAVKGVASGQSTRTIGVSGCTEGCRLTGLDVQVERGNVVRLTLHRIAQLDPPAEVVPAADLGLRSRWRGTPDVQLAARAGMLQVGSDPSPFTAKSIAVAAVDAPLPVPVAANVELVDNGSISSVDGEPIDAKVVSSPLMLPRLGPGGVLADLEYLERTALFAPRLVVGEVWLGPQAPPDAADRLRRGGLAISGTTGVAASRDAFSRQGPALALRFHLAAAIFGIVLALGGLGLVATVDRGRRADDLWALRQQGLSTQAVRRAALWGYLSTVGAAVVAGFLAAGLAWFAAGDRLPVFADAFDVLRAPRWPNVGMVVVPWAIATVAMVVGSVLAAWALRRAVIRKGKW